MATLNEGTLIVDTLVPQYVELTFPIVKSNDVQGGIHRIDDNTLNDVTKGFGTISFERRQWGMLAYVEPEKKTYQLVPTANSLLSDDRNWIVLQTGAGGGVEWVDSVFSIVSDAGSIGNKSTGDRYLVSPNPVASPFNVNKNRIATYNESAGNGAGGWSFGEPTNGSTLRVDNEPGALYTFTGTSSVAGKWTREYQNAVRYIEPTSDNGRTFSFITENQTPLSGYTYAVYFANFATSNSGTVSLSIDGNFYAPIYKAANGVLTELVSQDFESGIRYQLTYDSGNFQINLPSSGSGVIGEAEDANGYLDGLYTDFTTSTPVGTAIDRFNEILKFLVPPPAPDLSSWGVTDTSMFKAGKISYSYAQQPGLGVVSTTFSQISNVTLGELFSKGSPRLGVKKKSSGDISGIFNINVTGHPGQPSPAYATYSFGNGNLGDVVLYLNDVVISSVDLTSSYGGFDTTSSGNSSGMVISGATTSKFTTGAPFDSFWYRTGTFLIKYDDVNIEDGFNFIQVKHVLPSGTLTVYKLEFLIDAENTATSFVNAFPNSFQGPVKKFLSGIQYYSTGLQFQHNQQVNNIYRNTYYPDDDAGTFTDESSSDSSAIYNAGGNLNNSYSTNSSTPKAFSPDTSAFQSLPTPTDVNSFYTFFKKFNVKSSVRKISGRSTTQLLAKRSVQNSVTEKPLVINGWFIDTYPSSSTGLFEGFDDEDRRLTIDQYNTPGTIPTTGNWNSASSLRDTYTNGLQVADGRLLYPHYDFTDFDNSAGSDANTNPNKGAGNSRNYKNIKLATSNEIKGNGSRTYMRAFFIGSTPPKANLEVTILYNNTSFTSATNQLTGTNNNTKCILEFKLPYNGSFLADGLGPIGTAATGWLDATKPTIDKKFNDGDGCLVGTAPGAGGGLWKIGFGTRNSSHSSGWVLLRFTAGSEWSGYIESIDVKGV